MTKPDNRYAAPPTLFRPLIMIIVLACLSIGTFLLVFHYYMNALFGDVEKNYRQGLINVVSVARNAIEPELARVRSGEITRQEAIERIRPLIRSMTYEDQDGRNYIYMADYNGVTLVQPFMIEREMSNRIDFRDTRGLYIAREFIRAARERPEGAFVRYHYSHLPGDPNPEGKMAYVLGLPELECYIATGVFMEKTLKGQREILANIEYASIWLFVLSLVPVVISIYVIIKRNRRLLAEIATRKKAEGGAHENMELLRATLNATTDGILVVNKEKKITQVNRQFLDMWHVPAELRAENDDEKMLAFVADQVADRDGFLALVKALYQSRLDSLDEIVLKDGRIFERSSSPMILAGSEIGRVWDFRDITKRKQSEEGVRASRKLLNDVLQAAAFAIIAIDPDGMIRVFNKGAESMLGYSTEEVVGRQTPLVFHLECELEARRRELSLELGYPVAGFRVFTARAEIEGSETTEWTLVRKDGSTLLASLVTTAMHDDNGVVTGYLGIAKDITKSRQAEEKFSKIFMMTPAGIAITRMEDGYILDSNRVFEAMSGWNRDEVIGRSTRDIRFWVDQADRDLMVEELKAGIDVSSHEFRFRRKDGAERIAVYSAKAIRISDEDCLIFIALDITERKLAEEKFSKIFMMSPDMVSISRLEDGLIVDINLGFEEITGWKRDEVKGRHSGDLHFWAKPEDRALLVRELRAGIEVVHREIAFCRKDGSVRTGIYSARSIVIAGEEYLLFVMQDITERIQAEEKFSKIFMIAPDAIAITRMTDGMIMDVNPSFKEFWGWERDEVIGRTAYELDFWVDRADRERMAAELEAGSDVLYREFRFRRKGGSVRTGVFSARGIGIADEQCILLIMRDISEQKEAEEKSRLSEEKFSKIFMTTPDCIAITRMSDGRIIDVNPSFKEFWGWDRGEVIGRTSLEIGFWVDPADRASMVKDLEAGSDVLHRELSFRHKDGSLRTGIYSARRILIGGEDTLIFVMQDITDRIRLEEERRKLEAQLYQSQKMDAIGQLAGGVAHDFNNILMSIGGNASLVIMDYTPDHPHYKRLSRIEESVERGANLTRQLLGFARGGKYEVKALSVNDLVRSSARFFMETRKEIEADFELLGEAYTVEGDAGQLEQALLNIYINAGQAMPQGGRLHITTTNLTFQEKEAGRFEVKPGDYVRISISDTGVGMDKDTLKRIFEPFFTTKAEQGGTGLGLASAYGIIRNHGGVINAYSEPGRGSTFNIYLPSSDKRTVSGRFGRAGSSLQKGSGVIMLVDDEADILATAGELLRRLGYTVLKANSGQEAIALYREKQDQVDLVVLDMIMPGMGGAEALKALKEIRPEVKVILSSGYSLQGEAQRVMEMGCLGFIQKPYNFAEFSKALYKALNPADDTY
jgi:PAS domain S-box-containing protein